MNLSLEQFATDQGNWENKGYLLPSFDVQKMREKTRENVQWVHFGAGNIFRGFPAARMQDLLEKGLADTGIVVGEGFDFEIIEKIYKKYDNLSLLVTLKGDGKVSKRVVASIAESYTCGTQAEKDWDRLCAIFRQPSLQMVSFTITEKGYATVPSYVQEDILRGPKNCKTIICCATALAYERYKAGQHPFAFVSMDNCSHNGEKLQKGILEVAGKWSTEGLVPQTFVDYLNDQSKVAFPWSMIDKITPRPDPEVAAMLQQDGFEDIETITTSKNTWIAPFVNAEECEYLVIEDAFPNGRPALEKAGVYFTDRATVNKVEKMKVCTCLNPLHTAMSIMGCLLSFTKISEEMKDVDIVGYIKEIGYIEGMPVVVDPGILSPKSFIDDVVEKRLPNPFMPDTPQRIACDTSQKISIRFGETVKSYKESSELDEANLEFIPLFFASWIRYLMAIDDQGEAFEPSADPLLESCMAVVKDVRIGQKGPFDKILAPLLENPAIWGFDLAHSKLASKVLGYFTQMVENKGAVREVLHTALQKKAK
jgi:fructuronate reductase